jgi:hypothetical protein
MGQKPFATSKEPVKQETLSADVREAQEEAREKREAEARRARLIKTDGLQKLMLEEPYISECLMPALEINGRRVWVSRFYPYSQIAVDLFDTMLEQIEGCPKERFRLLRERGIKYAWLGPESGRLSEIADQLAEQT